MTTNEVADSTQEVMKVRYTAKTHTSGGRRGGVSRSDVLSTFCRVDKKSRDPTIRPSLLKTEKDSLTVLRSRSRQKSGQRLKRVRISSSPASSRGHPPCTL
jgi:hypothetical protein